MKLVAKNGEHKTYNGLVVVDEPWLQQDWVENAKQVMNSWGSQLTNDKPAATAPAPVVPAK